MKRFVLHAIFVLDGLRAFWATPFFSSRGYKDIFISAQEGPRDFYNTAKFLHLPHLYITNEETYDLKCLLSEIWPKNLFLAVAAENNDDSWYFGSGRS